MPSEFSSAGKAALRALPVPPLVMNSVRARAREHRSRAGFRRMVAGVMLSVGVVGAATVAVVKNPGVDLWVSGNKGAIVMHSLEWIRSPRAAEFRAAVAHAKFTIIYPMGLPADAKLVDMEVAPQGEPTSAMLDYRGPGGFHAQFILADASIVNATTFSAAGGRPQFGHVDTWRVGDEVVVVPKGVLSSDEIDRIKRAMGATSAAASAADVQNRLIPFIVLGGIDRVITAERYAPSTGRNVLIDDSQVHLLPVLISRRDPLLDSRIRLVSGFTYKDGKMLSARARPAGRASDDVAIDVSGMKAIESALRAHGMAHCRCDVLYHHGARAYTIWTLPRGRGAVAKYVVPAT